MSEPEQTEEDAELTAGQSCLLGCLLVGALLGVLLLILAALGILEPVLKAGLTVLFR